MERIYFVDHNVQGKAAAQLGGIQVGDFASCYTQGTQELEVMKAVTSDGSTMVTSQFCLDTLRRMLVAPAGDDFSALDARTARETTVAIAATVRASGGVIVDIDEMDAQRPLVERVVHGHIGRGRGEIDREDINVLASLFAAQELLGGRDVQVVLVTNDVGLQNCGRELAQWNIAVISATRYTRAQRAS
jgi:hypothetical protein